MKIGDLVRYPDDTPHIGVIKDTEEQWVKVYWLDELERWEFRPNLEVINGV